MNMEDISNIYQKNLISFFNNNKIIETIYTEQYGAENYNANKEKYLSEYKAILENTLFVPFVTLEHLETFLNLSRNKYGANFVEKNLKLECDLYRKLIAKKSLILNDYSATLLNDLIQKFPKIFDGCNLSEQFSSSDFDYNIQIIKDYLSKQKQSLTFKIQTRQINKLLNNYKKAVQEKILIETSSFFKHKSDVPNDKYYTSIITDMLKDESSVHQQIGKNTKHNYRYIYLPIFKFRTKQEYLNYAVHEVMHISKEKITDKQYRSGLFVRNLSSNKMSGNLWVHDNFLQNFYHSLKWFNFRKNNNSPEQKLSYHSSYIGNSEFEEVVHHWQVRRVVDTIQKNGLDSELKMPYQNPNSQAIHMTYEFSDEITKKFMAHFSNDIQQINNGNLSIESFKKKVKPSNFGLLGHLFESWDSLITSRI